VLGSPGRLPVAPPEVEAAYNSKGDTEGMLLQNAFVDALNDAEWAFPLAECVHIGGFAIGVGSIALVDFRMLNLGLRHETPARILRYTELWTIISLVFVVFSGAMLFVSQAGIYRVNQIFPIKMYVLLAALIYNFTIHRKIATMQNPPPVLSKVVAIVSLLLWVLVVFGGIFTGFLE
jgi:hypothetical protein